MSAWLRYWWLSAVDAVLTFRDVLLDIPDEIASWFDDLAASLRDIRMVAHDRLEDAVEARRSGYPAGFDPEDHWWKMGVPDRYIEDAYRSLNILLETTHEQSPADLTETIGVMYAMFGHDGILHAPALIRMIEVNVHHPAY